MSMEKEWYSYIEYTDLTLGKLKKKKKKHLDGLSPTYLKTPPPHPP